MFSNHSYASKHQLLQWVSELLRMDIQALEDVRLPVCEMRACRSATGSVQEARLTVVNLIVHSKLALPWQACLSGHQSWSCSPGRQWAGLCVKHSVSSSCNQTSHCGM